MTGKFSCVYLGIDTESLLLNNFFSLDANFFYGLHSFYCKSWVSDLLELFNY